MGERLIVSFSVSVSFSLLALSSCVQIDHLTILRTFNAFQSGWGLQHMQYLNGFLYYITVILFASMCIKF